MQPARSLPVPLVQPTPSLLRRRRAAQVSDRTRWLVAQDWIRSFFFGRNISDI